MGDRGEITFDFGKNKEIWFYSHWGGYELPHVLQSALRFGRPRWNNNSYLTRIIVSRVVGSQWDQETGFGLSPTAMESEYPNLIVHLEEQMITIGRQLFSFAAYLDLSEEALQALWAGDKTNEEH